LLGAGLIVGGSVRYMVHQDLLIVDDPLDSYLPDTNAVPTSLQVYLIGRGVFIGGIILFFLSAATIWSSHARLQPTSIAGLSNRTTARGIIFCSVVYGVYQLVCVVLVELCGRQFDAAQQNINTMILQYCVLITLVLSHDVILSFLKKPGNPNDECLDQEKYLDTDDDSTGSNHPPPVVACKDLEQGTNEFLSRRYQNDRNPTTEEDDLDVSERSGRCMGSEVVSRPQGQADQAENDSSPSSRLSETKPGSFEDRSTEYDRRKGFWFFGGRHTGSRLNEDSVMTTGQQEYKKNDVSEGPKSILRTSSIGSCNSTHFVRSSSSKSVQWNDNVVTQETFFTKDETKEAFDDTEDVPEKDYAAEASTFEMVMEAGITKAVIAVDAVGTHFSQNLEKYCRMVNPRTETTSTDETRENNTTQPTKDEPESSGLFSELSKFLLPNLTEIQEENVVNDCISRL
jgi:hypothetical protein